MGILTKACLDEGWACERRHVEDRAIAPHPTERRRHRGVGHLDHESDVGPQLADHQRTLERLELVDLGTDHGSGCCQPSCGERLGHRGPSNNEWDAPSLERSGRQLVLAVVDDHHTRLAAMQLLDDPTAHSSQPTDDDVTAQRGCLVDVGIRAHLGRTW